MNRSEQQATDAVSPGINREYVLDRCEYFVDVQVWPLHQVLDPAGWLENFRPEEMDYALHLLCGFIYFRHPMVDQLFLAAFQGLSSKVIEDPLATDPRKAWNSFLDTVVVTRVTGEQPHDTDSGFHFMRKARQLLGIPESRILSPQHVIDRLASGSSFSVVFVDDFVGSGDQFTTTWERMTPVNNGRHTSFAELASTTCTAFYYCPIVCTQAGLTVITRACPGLSLLPAHILPPAYSTLDENSILWPVNLKAGATAFLQEASARAGISAGSWKGYNDLGLAIGFEHSIPDATLPLFSWKQGNWKPLIRQS
ncbi:MAG: hypothetical protein NTV86_04715 [Planctomycetota bacterium]|nr:hypothetical protein [Planctomycetota bacterium]